MPLPHCPHCLLPMFGASALPYPAEAMRCPNCRLIIGPGRARAEASDDGDARSRGSAAGVLANAARRAQSEPAGLDEIVVALRACAEEMACPVERLRMLDYQQLSEADPEIPDLSAVLATFSTWKAARSSAAVRDPAESAPAIQDGADDAQVA